MKYYSKQDTINLMQTILNPLKPLYSKNCARLKLGDFGTTYNDAGIELESFSRPLWALVPFWAGGGSDTEFENIYKMGLASGTNPQSVEFWGHCGNFDQRFVEMAAIACGILTTPNKLWHVLNNDEKQNLANWLNEINAHDLPVCNWRFFRVLVNLALDSVNMPCNNELVDSDLNLLDTYYKGDGWYSDGASPQKDYYIPWAIQYYSVLYSKFAEKRDPVRAKIYKERAILFGKQFAYWFDENGAALPFGRSLTYRFAQCSFWSACVFAGIEPLPMAEMKGLINRNFKWWMDKTIFDRDGILYVGYCYPQMYMAERYNSPGSSYWGLKAFVHLALPDEHEFWQIKAKPMPKLDKLYTMRHADMLMQRCEHGGVNGYAAGVNELYGHGQFPQKYSKFVYSTRFGFSACRSMEVIHEAAPDCMLGFELDDNIFVRKVSKKYEVRDNSVWSVWEPFIGITVETTITPTKTGHTRKHIIKSEYDCYAYDCGFAVAKFTQGFEISENKGVACAKNNEVGCKVIGEGQSINILADPNTNLYHKNTVIPAIKYKIKKGENTIETIIEEF